MSADELDEFTGPGKAPRTAPTTSICGSVYGQTSTTPAQRRSECFCKTSQLLSGLCRNSERRLFDHVIQVIKGDSGLAVSQVVQNNFSPILKTCLSQRMVIRYGAELRISV